MMNKHFAANPQAGAQGQGQGDGKEAAPKEEESPDVRPTKPILTAILRKHVTDTVLYMLKAFEFCSISHQQAI